MPAYKQTRFDGAVAFILALRPLFYAIVAGIIVLCTIAILRSESEFLREWATEILGSTLVFVAVSHVHPQRIQAWVFSSILLVGMALGAASYIVRTNHILTSLLIKVACGLVLFAGLEIVLRHALAAAKRRESSLAQKVCDVRNETTERLVGYVKAAIETGKLPADAMENYADAMEDLIFPNGTRPVAGEMVRDDPEWITLWTEGDG